MRDGLIPELQASCEKIMKTLVLFDVDIHPCLGMIVFFNLRPCCDEAGANIVDHSNSIVLDVMFVEYVFLDGGGERGN